MAKFKGEVTFKVTFKGLGVPVGFGMTNAIIFHECATQVGLKTPWSKIPKNYKDKRFNVEIIDKKIDFHGKGLVESEKVFSDTILNCYNSGYRCLLFVTGKGLFKKSLSNEKNPKLYHGVIRSAFIDWVKSSKFSKYILSFVQASIKHGGDGAFYVYLRKKIKSPLI